MNSESANAKVADQPQCPFCNGNDTRLFSAFGSQLSVSTYWCNACHTAFEKLKRLHTER